MNIQAIIRTVIASNLFPIVGLIFLLFLIRLNPLFEKRQRFLFVLAISVNLLLLFTTSLDFVFSRAGASMWIFRRVTTFINFSAGPVIPLLLLQIFRRKGFRLSRYLPFLINLLICFISIFTRGVVFFISPKNDYGRGPLFVLPLLTSIFYLGMLIFLPIKSSLQSKRIERNFLFVIVLLLICSVVLEVRFSFQFMNWICSAVALISYYLLLTILGSIVDPLTKAYNRLMYTKAIAKHDRKTRCMVALVDVNNLKYANDTFGHEAGDRLLIKLVEYLNLHIAKHASIYRIGGDEFVVISDKQNVDAFRDCLESALQAALGEQVSFAYGITEYLPQDHFLEAVKLADTRMYEHKCLMKQEAPRDRAFDPGELGSPIDF